MVERNPYETNSPVDVPSFMKEDKEEKEKVNMNVFKLKDEEIDDEDDDYDDEDDETDEYEVPRKPVSSKTLLTIALVVAILIAAVCGIFLISRNNAYESLENEYKTYQETSNKKVERLESQIETLNKEIETLKTAQTETKTEDTSSSSSSSSSSSGSSATVGSFKTGTYTIDASMTVRSGAGTNFPKVTRDKTSMTQQLWEDTYTDSSMVTGATVTVSEIKVNGDQTWGKIGDGCWICLKYEDVTYVTFIK